MIKLLSSKFYLSNFIEYWDQICILVTSIFYSLIGEVLPSSFSMKWSPEQEWEQSQDWESSLRSYPELGIQRIFVLVICIMWCKTIWVHHFHTSRNDYKSRNEKAFFQQWKFLNMPLPNPLQTSNFSKLSIPRRQMN